MGVRRTVQILRDMVWNASQMGAQARAWLPGATRLSIPCLFSLFKPLLARCFSVVSPALRLLTIEDNGAMYALASAALSTLLENGIPSRDWAVAVVRCHAEGP